MTDAVLKCGEPVDNLIALVADLLRQRGHQATVAEDAHLADGWLYLTIQGQRTRWNLKVEDSSSLEYKLPEIQLAGTGRLLAHVSHCRVVCTTDGQGLSIDTNHAASVVAHTVCDAYKVLEDADLDSTVGSPGYLDELEGYWEGIPGVRKARISFEVDDRSRYVSCHAEHVGKGSSKCKYFTERGGQVPPEFDTSSLTVVKALYLALDVNVLPPAQDSPLTGNFIQRVLDAAGENTRVLWDDIARKHWNGRNRLCTVLISQPRPSGGRSLIGMSLSFNGRELGDSTTCNPLSLKRHTTSYMRDRGGASEALASKHVAVLGCGSVGSEIADALASCGIGHLTLVDSDNMDVENVFRHVLGRQAIGQTKVSAMASDLANKYPGLVVTTARELAQQWLESIGPNQFDCIAIAIGNPAVDRMLAKAIRSRAISKNLVVTWLEPLGLGGHVVGLPSLGTGCLECIFRADEGVESLHPMVSFVKPNQVFSRSLTGCLGTFIPYSALHSRKTALLAADAILSRLDRVREPAYVYWVGDGAQAASQGFQVSDWFERARSLTSEQATRVVFDSPCSHCRTP